MKSEELYRVLSHRRIKLPVTDSTQNQTLRCWVNDAEFPSVLQYADCWLNAELKQIDIKNEYLLELIKKD